MDDWRLDRTGQQPCLCNGFLMYSQPFVEQHERLAKNEWKGKNKQQQQRKKQKEEKAKT